MTLSNGEMAAHVDPNTLAAFVDQRLDDESRAAVVAHMAECAACRARLAALARGLDVPRPRLPAWLPVAALLAVTAMTGVMVWRSGPNIEPAPEGTARDIALPPSASAPLPPASSEPETSAQPAPVDDLATRRSSVRRVGDRTFRLEAGEWVDSAYDPLALLPLEEIAGAEARAEMLHKVPALRPYAALGPRVLVVHDGAVYQFRPE